jgi:hypothetical protein
LISGRDESTQFQAAMPEVRDLTVRIEARQFKDLIHGWAPAFDMPEVALGTRAIFADQRKQDPRVGEHARVGHGLAQMVSRHGVMAEHVADRISVLR